MSLQSNIATDTVAKDKGKDEVSVSSESLNKLKAGLTNVNEYTKELKENWEKKVSQAKDVIRCKKCGKTFKNKAGVKCHWRAKKNECQEKDGYEIVPDIVVSVKDRLTPKQMRIEELREKSDKAAKEITAELTEKKTPDDKIYSAEDLYAAHVSKLSAMLKTVDIKVIHKFLAMRFDINNCTKQHLGLKELAARKKNNRG